MITKRVLVTCMNSKNADWTASLQVWSFFPIVANCLYPIATRKAKIVYNLGISECNRVKDMMKAKIGAGWSEFLLLRCMQGSYASGKLKIFQGQGIVREFHNLSWKIEFLLKCQGNVREF